MLQTKVVEKMKTHTFCSVTFFQKSHSLWDKVEKFSGYWRATNDVTIWLIRVACWISKAICTHARSHAHASGYPHAVSSKHVYTDQYVILISFPQQQWFHERASLLLSNTLPVLFKSLFSKLLSYLGLVYLLSSFVSTILGLLLWRSCSCRGRFEACYV
jgi:hypothetical protein